MSNTPRPRTVKRIVSEFMSIKEHTGGHAINRTVEGSTDRYDILWILYPIPEIDDPRTCTIFADPDGVRWETTNHPEAYRIEQSWRPELMAAIVGAEPDTRLPQPPYSDIDQNIYDIVRLDPTIDDETVGRRVHLGREAVNRRRVHMERDGYKVRP